MIRAPGINSVLNVASTLRQFLSRKSALEDLLSGELRQLRLREVSSASLYLLACRRADARAKEALCRGCQAEVAKSLAHWSDLLQLGEVLDAADAVRPAWAYRQFQKLSERWYKTALAKGLEAGFIKPGETRGIPALVLLQASVEASTFELMDVAQKQQQTLLAAVQRGLAGQSYLDLGDEDLIGLTDKMKSVWASHLGSAAVWRRTKYRVPVGWGAMNMIADYCQNAATRRRMFEAFYAGFDTSVDEAALELLRTRRQIAQRLGFRSWAHLQMAPMVVSDEAAAHEFMDRCWKDAQPSVSAVYKQIGEWSSRDAGSTPRGRGKVSQVDEAFWHAHLSRQADTWKLAEYLPAAKCLPSILEVVGKAYAVTFREVEGPSFASRLLSGWHTSVQIFEVCDGRPRPAGVKGEPGRGLLGYVYLDVYARRTMLGRPTVKLAGAQLLCAGHAFLSCNFEKPGMGQQKLLNVEEVVALAHELGHAVHMLCHTGCPQQWQDLPLDVVELPSTLAETIALQPASMAKYARHMSTSGSPPEALVRSCQRQPRFFTNILQNASVSLGLHAEDFDPFSATPADVRARAVASWQRYSVVPADPAFNPLGGDCGIHLAHGTQQVAYLLCYLRVSGILQAKQGRKEDAAWFQPDFANRIRKQLLDPAFPSKGWASLFPAKADGEPGQHPLPPPPKDTSVLFQANTR